MPSPNKTIEVSKEIYGDKEWMSDFVFVMESLGAARPTKEPEKWEQLLVLIEVKKRESHAAGVEEGIRKAIHTIDKLEVYNTKGMTWEIAKREILKALESLGSN